MKNFFKAVTIQKKLFSTLLILISVPILFLGAILLVRTNHSMTTQYTEQVEMENARAKAIFFDLTTNIYNVSEAFVYDTNLTDMLSQQYADEAALRKSFDTYNLLTTTLSQQTSFQDISIYTNNPSITIIIIFFTVILKYRKKTGTYFLLTMKGAFGRLLHVRKMILFTMILLCFGRFLFQQSMTLQY